MAENDKKNTRETGSDSLREQLEKRMSARKDAEKGQENSRYDGQPSIRKTPPAGRLRGLLSRRVRTKDIVVFCDEAALLLHAGMPLVPAMRTIAARASNPSLARMISDMADRVEGGVSFTEAASAYSREFGHLFIGIFRAGERSGTLVDALRRVADRGEHVMDTRHRIIGALIYPVIIVIAAIGVLGFAFSYMMSAFQPVMEDMGIAVPATMQTALRIGLALRSGGFWFSLVLLIGALVAGYFIGIQFSGFRLVRDRLLIRCPFVQKFVKQKIVSDFGRIFSTMLQAGVPLPDALQATRETTRNEVVRLAVDRTQKNVREGGRVTPPLAREKIFPPLAYDMMYVGEETGALSDVFERLAEIYEKKEANDLEILGKILQPAIIVVLAVIVGFVVLTLFQTYATFLNQMPGAF